MKYKLWRRRLSVSAPRMTIKTHLPWPLKLLFAIVVIGLGGGVALWTYDLGRSFTTSKPAAVQLKVPPVAPQIVEAPPPAPNLNTRATDSQVTILESAQAQLLAQVKALEQENSRLKEDLAFFESILPEKNGSKRIAIQRLTIESVAPNQLRYRLLVMQNGKGERGFAGTLQIALNVVQNGKSAMMSFPEKNAGDLERYKLDFKHYQRVEGVLTLPEGSIVKNAQIRVLENGQVRAQQSATL